MDRQRTADGTVKSLLHNDAAALLLRLVVGFVFVVASIEKLADPAAFAVAIGHYRIAGPPLTTVAATVLPWVELFAGLGLVFGVFVRGNALLCSLMMLIFTAAVIAALVRGLDISCGCFTQDPAAARMGWGKAVENGGLLLCSILAYFSRGYRYTLERLLPSLR